MRWVGIGKRIASLLAVGVASYLIISLVGVPEYFGQIDFLQYWAGAQLMWEGGNPYAAAEIHAIELQVTSYRDLPIRLWNPPFIYPFILPLAFLPFNGAVWSWFLASVSLAAVAVEVSLLPFRERLREKGWILPLLLCSGLFYPVLLTLYYGQSSHLLFLALATYLALSFRGGRLSDSFWAGAALSVTLVKPHLLHLLYVFVVVDAVRFGRWGTVKGFVIGAATLAFLASLLQPYAFGYYLNALASPPIHWRTPTLGSWLQSLSGLHLPVVRLLPTLFAQFLILTVLMRARGRTFTPSLVYLLIPISLITAPYGWVYDQVLLLPSIFWCIWKGVGYLQLGSPKALAFTAAGLFQAMLLFYFIPGELGQDIYVWFPALVAILVLWLRRFYVKARRKMEETPSPVELHS